MLRQGVILTLSRLGNYGVLIFSPIVLIRILDIEQYGPGPQPTGATTISLIHTLPTRRISNPRVHIVTQPFLG